MSCEFKCEGCDKAKLIKRGEEFRHRYGMIAINYGDPFFLRKCTTEEEKSYDVSPDCDRPGEFVAKDPPIG